MHVVPDLYGYLALSIPFFVWDILFSPFGSRISDGSLIAVLLIVMNLEKGRINSNVNIRRR